MLKTIALKITFIVLISAAFAAAAQSQPISTTEANARDFAVKVTEFNATEVELGRMAIQKAQSTKVKEYAQMLVADHTQSFERLQGLTTESRSGTAAMSQQLSRRKQQEIDRLSRLTGNQFDREFMRLSIQNHSEALPLFDRYAALDAVNDRTVLYAKDMLLTERKHLLRAEEIQREMQTTQRR